MSSLNSNNSRNSEILTVGQHFSAVDYGKCSCCNTVSSGANKAQLHNMLNKKLLFFVCSFIYCKYILW